MSYGVLEYDRLGRIKCEICQEYFDRVASHARQAHFITARDYKKQYGFDAKKGLTSKRSRDLSRQRVYMYYDLCIKQNLLDKGSKTRFSEGSAGRPSEVMSEQTRRRVSELGKNTPISERTRRGRILGKSGKGNTARWKDTNNDPKDKRKTTRDHSVYDRSDDYNIHGNQVCN